MRIIGGEARGRKLKAPEGRGTRPILDQLKQRTFDILGPLEEGTRVWDLFAGAGSLGLEALSRGAEHCVFFERDRKAAQVIQDNIATLGWEDRARVVQGDALRPNARVRPEESEPLLVFSDPPFPLVIEEPERIRDHFEALWAHLKPRGGRLVLRYPSELKDWNEPEFFAQADIRPQGVNVLVIAG